MDHIDIKFTGPAVFQVLMESRVVDWRCGPGEGLHLRGLEEHFNFSAHGVEVNTKVWAKRVDNGERVQRDAWVSFPYSTVLTVIRMPLLPEEIENYRKLKQLSVETIGFDTSKVESTVATEEV